MLGAGPQARRVCSTQVLLLTGSWFREWDRTVHDCKRPWVVCRRSTVREDWARGKFSSGSHSYPQKYRMRRDSQTEVGGVQQAKGEYVRRPTSGQELGHPSYCTKASYL